MPPFPTRVLTALATPLSQRNLSGLDGRYELLLSPHCPLCVINPGYVPLVILVFTVGGTKNKPSNGIMSVESFPN